MIDSIESLLKSIDQQTAAFSQLSKFNCPPGCGACCQTPFIETTVAEMLPAARFLFKSKRFEDILEQTAAREYKGQCVFFIPDVNRSGNGSCSIYQYRPGLCRLFGYSARRDSHGHQKLATCKVIKNLQPEEVKKTEALLDQGVEAPLINEHSLKVMAVDPILGKDQCPINLAVKKAIEKVGLMEQISPTEKLDN